MTQYEKYYDKIHGHPMNYTQAQCSASHTFGNVTAFIQNWLINLFPDGLFKTIHVNSKIAHKQLRSTPNEFLKKKSPMFIIRPRIEWRDNARFLSGTRLIERQTDIYSTTSGTNLQEFIHDDKNKVAMKFQLNRSVMLFDVILSFKTMMSQMNWASYFLNAVRQEVPFFLSTSLESYLSPELLNQLSQCVGIPMYDENGCNKDFIKYLNSNSKFPITYKLQGSTGTEEFYRYYPTNIDTIITNFNTDDGEKVGQISTHYNISFTIRCEFFSTGFYYLFSDKLKQSNIITVHEDDSTIIPIFTDVLTREDIDIPLGWKLFASPSCMLEKPNDHISLDSLLNDSIKTTIKFHLERGIPLTEFFKLRVRKQGKLLNYGEDYEFNLSNYELTFKNANTYYTYKILIFINVDYINNLIKDVYNLK